jgi:hypothetical protein
MNHWVKVWHTKTVIMSLMNLLILLIVYQGRECDLACESRRREIVNSGRE